MHYRRLGSTELSVSVVGAGHLSERLIGNALAGRCHEWIIATKFGHNPGNDLKDENYSPSQVLLQLEASLRADGSCSLGKRLVPEAAQGLGGNPGHQERRASAEQCPGG